MPYEYFVWDLATKTGWTLEYIRNLKYGEMVEWLEIKDAINKANRI